MQDYPPVELTNAALQRRRAQNRAAQRAFRERKEKHARDLEDRLADMTDKYKSLEASHSELSSAHEKLQRTLDLLTSSTTTSNTPSSDDARGGGAVGTGERDTLRKLLVLLHGDVRMARAGEREAGREEQGQSVKVEGAAS